MAYKKTYKKKTYKKKSYKKKYSVWKSLPNTARRIKLNIMATFTFTPDGAAGRQFVSFTFPLNFPTMHTNSAGTFTQIAAGSGIRNPNIGTSWQNMFSTPIFDEYRVHRLRFIMIPSNVSTITSTAIAPTSAIQDPNVLYMYHDPDDGIVLSAESQALNRGVPPRSITQGKPIRYSILQPKYKRNRWLNTSNYNADPAAAVTGNTQGMELGYESLKLGYVYNGTGAQQAFAQCYVIWECEFKNLRQSA